MHLAGDNAPREVIKGAVKAIGEIESEIVLIGNEEIINKEVKALYKKDTITQVSDRISIVNTTQVITNDDTPTKAIKTMKDSSMVVGFNMLKEGKGDAFVSAGSTGALLTGAILLVGRIKGVDRPAMTAALPAYKKSLFLIDAGSNTNCKVINYLQFAQMATIYLKNVMKIENPKIGLLNIGTEETKGTEIVKEAYQELKKLGEEGKINFIGNIEGRDAFSGEVDAIVTDGFSGNIFLKAVEGLGGLVKISLSEEIKKNPLTILQSLPTLPIIGKFKKRMDYKEYGGALFLGVNKPVIKAHGSGDEKVFYYTIKQAEQFAKNKAVEKIIENLGNN